MGHDIYAERYDDAQREAASTRHRIDSHDDSWMERYDAYKDEVYVAYLRRNAFDEWNTALYLSLDAMDAYAGCSGSGEARAFTVAQFETARERLASMKRAPGRAKSFADLLPAMFAGQGAEVSTGDTYDTSAPELEFVQSCITFLRETGRETLTVSFG